MDSIGLQTAASSVDFSRAKLVQPASAPNTPEPKPHKVSKENYREFHSCEIQ